MNNSIKEVNELKELIIESDEYKNYNFYLNLLETNTNIKELINQITTLQKKIVNLKSKKNDYDEEEKRLNDLYNKLNSNDTYKMYIESSKKLNILITNIQQKFQDFFDSLVC